MKSCFPKFGPVLAVWLGLALFVPAKAVERVLEVVMPRHAAVGEAVEVVLRASTDAGAGEQIGFLHAQVSVDGGRSWSGLCYEDNLGAAAERHLHLTAGAAGSRLMVRAKAAFRQGPAGDVDFAGAAIKWQTSWAKWSEPPAKVAVAVVGE